MLNYTTAWAQKLTKTQEAYDAWLSTLKCQDSVIVQLFQPKENNLLGCQFECWQFYKARLLKYESGGWEVDYNHKFVPIRKNGLLCYYGTKETPWGEVFPGRIVPDHHDLHQEGSNLFIGHAPVYEPNWVFKAVFMNHYGPRKLYKIPFDYYYKYKVSGGDLIIAFGQDEEELIKSAPKNLTFLYSEYLE